MTVIELFFAEEIIEVGIQSSVSHYPRVLTLECPAGSVSRIGKERFFCCFPFGVKLLERLPGHENLTPYLKRLGSLRGVDYEGNGADGFYVRGDIVATYSIATGDSPDELVILIDEGDGESIKLQFTAHLKRLSLQSLLHRT